MITNNWSMRLSAGLLEPRTATEGPRGVSNLLLLTSSNLLSNEIPLVTGSTALLIGGGAEGARSGDARLKELDPGKDTRPTDPDFLEAFVEEVENGLTSVLAIAQTKSGWNPFNPNDQENRAAFVRYTDELATFPLLKIEEFDQEEVDIVDSNFDAFIDEVVGLFDGVTKSEEEQVRNSLEDLASRMFSNQTSERSIGKFVQGTIQSEDGVIRVYLSSSLLTLAVDESGKGTVTTSTAIVQQARYRFSSGGWDSEMAALIAGNELSGVEDWLEGFTTPFSESGRPQLCIGKTKQNRSAVEDTP